MTKVVTREHGGSTPMFGLETGSKAQTHGNPAHIPGAGLTYSQSVDVDVDVRMDELTIWLSFESYKKLYEGGGSTPIVSIQEK